MSKWRKIKFVLFTLSFIIAFIGNFFKEIPNRVEFDWIFIVFFFSFFSILLPILIRIQCKAPYIKKEWVLPSLDTNFLVFGDPLHFFHAVSYVMLFAGSAEIFASLIFAKSNFMEGVMLLSSGLGLWVGVIISTSICKFKYK